MANIRKQVMLNLKIQTANVPVKNTVIVSKVSGGMKLVNCPVFFHFALVIRHGIFRAINHVCGLKNNGQNKTTNIMHDDKPDQYLPPCQRKDHSRKHHDVKDIKYF